MFAVETVDVALAEGTTSLAAEAGVLVRRVAVVMGLAVALGFDTAGEVAAAAAATGGAVRKASAVTKEAQNVQSIRRGLKI